MNPAGLKTNINDLEDGGILIINTDAFTKNNLNKAHYKSDPLDDGSLSRYRLFKSRSPRSMPRPSKGST
jgi:2-oxoglutarate ferredoxin oxidoreductase subunit alpha